MPKTIEAKKVIKRMLNKPYNYIIVFTILLFLVLKPSVSQACIDGNPNDLTYSRRENNRCEGLIPKNASSGDIDLISFSTSNLDIQKLDYPDKLIIRVPNVDTNAQIKLLWESPSKIYISDEFLTDKNTIDSSGFTFNLPTNILKQGKIPFKEIKATAVDSNYYHPVIFGKPSDHYDFILTNPKITIFSIFQIRNDKDIIVVSKRANLTEYNYIRFSWNGLWNGKKAPAGIYKIYLNDQSGKETNIFFKHNPQWLVQRGVNKATTSNRHKP